MAAMAQHVQGMLDLQKLGAVTFDYGNNIRTFAFEQGVKNAYDFPGFVPAYIRPLFCEGKGPFRWAALSGEASDIARTDRLVLEMFPQNEHLKRWITLAQKRVKFQGLPSRICWLGYGERDKFGLALNDPGMGVIRHVDAGYPEAIEFAKRRDVKVPMLSDSGSTKV